MTIVRYENLTINNVENGTDLYGAYTTTITEWFQTRGLVHDVANSLRISERYRVYQDLVSITVNYTPNTKEIVDNQNLYSITWRGFDWRDFSIMRIPVDLLPLGFMDEKQISSAKARNSLDR